MIQTTSLEAYDKVKFSNWCNYEKEMILKMLDEEPQCARDMARVLEVHPYTLRPRVTELQKTGKIMDSGDRKTFYYRDRNGKDCMSREIIWRITPTSYHSGFLF